MVLGLTDRYRFYVNNTEVASNCTFDFFVLVEEPGFKNVKNKHLGMSPF